MSTNSDAPALETQAPRLSAQPAFDLGCGWRLTEQVALRPEPFGALVYHFGTRRLSFLKSRTLLRVVETLADHADALEACRAAGVTPAELPNYARALGALASSGTIERRAE